MLDIPQGSTSPSVRVDGKVYFVGELLQSVSGEYFIPERFFQRLEAGTSAVKEAVLYSIGRDVRRSEVSFIHMVL